MSKVLKASTVKIDENNVINVEIMNASAFQAAAEAAELVREEYVTEEEAVEISEQIIEEAKKNAQIIKDNAIAEVESEISGMKAAAESEIEELKESAYSEAYEEGRQKAEEEAERIIREAEQIKKQALIDKEEIINSAEPKIVELVSDIVKKLIGDALKLKPELIMFLIKQGLSQTSIMGEITVHVSEFDYDTVISDKNELLSMTEAGAKIEVIKDLSLNPSDCIIETQFGNIDCSLNQQYEALKENLNYICKNRFADNSGE